MNKKKIYKIKHTARERNMIEKLAIERDARYKRQIVRTRSLACSLSHSRFVTVPVLYTSIFYIKLPVCVVCALYGQIASSRSLLRAFARFLQFHTLCRSFVPFVRSHSFGSRSFALLSLSFPFLLKACVCQHQGSSFLHFISGYFVDWRTGRQTQAPCAGFAILRFHEISYSSGFQLRYANGEHIKMLVVSPTFNQNQQHFYFQSIYDRKYAENARKMKKILKILADPMGDYSP